MHQLRRSISPKYSEFYNFGSCANWRKNSLTGEKEVGDEAQGYARNEAIEVQGAIGGSEELDAIQMKDYSWITMARIPRTVAERPPWENLAFMRL